MAHNLKIDASLNLDFKDVLIKPKYSDVCSRQDVIIEKFYKFRNSGQTWSGTPIIAANLSTVGTVKMAETLSKNKILTALHKFYSVEELSKFFSTLSDKLLFSFLTIGITDNDIDKLKQILIKGRPKFLCCDVANGNTQFVCDRLRIIRKICPDSILMAGNVISAEMVHQYLLNCGVDIVKVGIGPGALCETRKVTGCGVCQLSAIGECTEAAHGLKGHVCADGGIKEPGDLCKAFAAGADFVMIGSVLNGVDECWGTWENHYYPALMLNTSKYPPTKECYGSEITNNEQNHWKLRCYGMSSEEAQLKFYGELKKYRSPEGKSILVDYKGPVQKVIDYFLGGLRSAMTYTGASCLKDFPKCSTFATLN